MSKINFARPEMSYSMKVLIINVSVMKFCDYSLEDICDIVHNNTFLIRVIHL